MSETSETLNEMMRDYAEAAVEIAGDYKIVLDYSEQSLQSVEKILDKLSAELHNIGGKAGPEGGVDEQTVMMCKLWGGYVGEVVRRKWGGEWAMETYPGSQFATLTLNVRGGKMFPSIKVYHRLVKGPDENIWTFYQTVKEKLLAAPKHPTKQ
jgi:hypothetical protein